MCRHPNKRACVCRSVVEGSTRNTSSMAIKMLSRAGVKGGDGQCIRATLPYIRSDLPILVVFRALGFTVRAVVCVCQLSVYSAMLCPRACSLGFVVGSLSCLVFSACLLAWLCGRLFPLLLCCYWLLPCYASRCLLCGDASSSGMRVGAVLCLRKE